MGWGRYGVCEACWEEVAPFTSSGCAICGGAIPQRAAGARARCQACRDAAPPFAAVAAYGAYAGRLRELIHALKFHGRERLAGPLGRLAASGLRSSGFLGGADGSILVPVPLSRERLARRGYNQSDLIARALRRELGRETGGRPEVVPALKKIVETAPQAGRSRSERLRSPAGAYALAGKARKRVDGRGVVLVDDVFTTGATAGECARVLAAAGAGEIIVAVVARTEAASGFRS